MNATAEKTQTLEFKWTTSRARDSYGYNVCTLFVGNDKAARTCGGGYDMKGTVLGRFIGTAYADRLCDLKPDDMPENSHWERAENPRKVCRNVDCILEERESETDGYYPHDMENCPRCGKELSVDWNDGQRVNDGRYFYGLTFHDPNYDPGKAVIGVDCSDRTLGGDGAEGKTVEQAEQAGVSFGLERLQAAYTASSKHATSRHTVPVIDGACGMSSVEKIMQAIGLSLEWVRGRRNRRDDIYILHDHKA